MTEAGVAAHLIHRGNQWEISGESIVQRPFNLLVIFFRGAELVDALRGAKHILLFACIEKGMDAISVAVLITPLQGVSTPGQPSPWMAGELVKLLIFSIPIKANE